MVLRSISSTILAGCMLVGTAATSFAETTLNFSNYIPAGHFFNERIMNVWAQNVSEVTEGRVTINFLPKVVGSPLAQYDVVVDGLADIALFNPGYSPGRFDLVGIGEAPLLSTNPKAASIAFWRLYETELAPLGLFQEVKILSTFTAAPGHIVTRGQPPRSAAELIGMKLRSPLPVTKTLLENLGAVPISKPVSEAYELMSTGVIDGTLLGFDTVKGFKLDEVSGGAIEVPGGLYNAAIGIAMNRQKWDRLSDEDQEAIMRISGEALAALVGEEYATALGDGAQALKDAGVEYVVADAAFVDAVREASEPIYDKLKALAADAGAKDPDQIIERYKALIAEVEAQFGS